MKQSTKQAKLITMLALLVLAFLCTLNVTNSYFTAVANVPGTIDFYGLDVRFMYRKDSNSTLEQAGAATSHTIYLQPASGTIDRGESFQLALKDSTTPIDTIAIRNLEGSCSCYIRFWIDAYVVTNITTNDVDTSTNYGKYFFLPEDGNSIFTRSNSSSASSWCYYIKGATPPHSESYSTIELGNTLTLQDIKNESGVVTDAVPISLLGERLQISISLQAVQSVNTAFSSVFNDTKGYYRSWR